MEKEERMPYFLKILKQLERLDIIDLYKNFSLFHLTGLLLLLTISLNVDSRYLIRAFTKKTKKSQDFQTKILRIQIEKDNE